MIKNVSISKKIIIGFMPMIILLAICLVYFLVQISGVNQNLSVLKRNIDEQASYGTSLFLLNNINRREQLNQQYLVSQKDQFLEIIQLLENDFELLMEERLQNASAAEKQELQAIAAIESEYVRLLRDSLWPTQTKLGALLNQYNSNTGPHMEKLAYTVRDLGVLKNDINVADIGGRLASSALSARAYFNQYIANHSKSTLERAQLELTTAKFALFEFSSDMQSESRYSYGELVDNLDQIENTMAEGKRHVQNLEIVRSQAEDLASRIINEMLSQQIGQWRGMNYEALKIYDFMQKFQWQSALSLSVALIVGIGVLLFISRLIVSNLNLLLSRVSQISEGEGDLTKRVEVDSKDETGLLAQSLNRFIDTVHGIVLSAQENSSVVIDKSQQNLNNANRSSELLDEQQRKNQLVFSAVEQLSVASNDIAESLNQSSSEVESTFSALEQGAGVVDQSVLSVQRLNQQMETATEVSKALEKETEEISKVLDVIKTMAEQTNLLALNAAIEAARAGEAGRGFAVVADEVRTLANRTQQSASEIDQSVSRLQTESSRVLTSISECYVHSEESATAAEKTQQTFVDVRESVEKIHSMSTSIATAAEEQSQVTANIRHDLEEVFNFSESVAQAAQQSQEASKDSTESATALNQVLTKFVV